MSQYIQIEYNFNLSSALYLCYVLKENTRFLL